MAPAPPEPPGLELRRQSSTDVAKPRQPTRSNEDASHSPDHSQDDLRTSRGSPELDDEYVTFGKRRCERDATRDADIKHTTWQVSILDKHDGGTGSFIRRLDQLRMRLSRSLSASAIAGKTTPCHGFLSPTHDHDGETTLVPRSLSPSPSESLERRCHQDDLCRHNCRQRGPCVLYPHVALAPEFTALEIQQQSFWVAVEVSGRCLGNLHEEIWEEGAASLTSHDLGEDFFLLTRRTHLNL